jgi:uncharacterized membrane protein YgcG
MPPRHHYWTIILEGKPTAFRAHTHDELVPTLRQLQARHPDAVMKWFARGRLWESQDEERAEASARRRAPREQRPRDWRPGGEHADPRDRFQIPRDEKRRRFAEKMRRDRDRPLNDREDRAARPPREERRPPSGRPPSGARPSGPRPPDARPHGGRPPGVRKPGGGNRGGGNRGGGNRGGGNAGGGGRSR